MTVDIDTPEKIIVKECFNFKEHFTAFIFTIQLHYFKRINDFFRNEGKNKRHILVQTVVIKRPPPPIFLQYIIKDVRCSRVYFKFYGLNFDLNDVSGV